MSRLEEDKRIMQVLGRATYGMKQCNKPMTKWEKIKFFFNIKRWWNMWKLKQALKKQWHSDRKRYRDTAKELRALQKEQEKQRLQYDMTRYEWRRPSC